MEQQWFITAHARDRFMERNPHKYSDPDKAMRKMKALLSVSCPLRDQPNILYTDGWAFVSKGQYIVTAMKPRERWLMDLIYRHRNPRTSPDLATADI